MVERVLFAPGGATEDKQDDLLAALALLQAELDQKFESGQQVALDAATLAALETINVLVGNWPADFPLPAAQVTALTPPTPQTDALTDAELRAAPVEVTGDFSSDGLTNAELRAAPVEVSGNVDVSGPIALDAGTLAALETINAVCSGTVALDAGTLAALETITVAVSNLPAEYPLPAAQVIALTPPTPQTDALTDAELRASPVEVTGAGLATEDNQTNGNQVTNERSKLDLVPYAEELAASDSITPSAGMAIEVVWVQIIPDPDNSNGNLVTIGFDGGLRLYRVYALGRSAIFTGAPDQALMIDLENSQNVTVNIHYREV